MNSTRHASSTVDTPDQLSRSPKMGLTKNNNAESGYYAKAFFSQKHNIIIEEWKKIEETFRCHLESLLFVSI